MTKIYESSLYGGRLRAQYHEGLLADKNLRSMKLFLFHLLLSVPLTVFGQAPALQIPDLTRSNIIPEKSTHDRNLGPLGLRGWIFCSKSHSQPQP
jgi:hypothetical protein